MPRLRTWSLKDKHSENAFTWVRTMLFPEHSRKQERQRIKPKRHSASSIEYSETGSMDVKSEPVQKLEMLRPCSKHPTDCSLIVSALLRKKIKIPTCHSSPVELRVIFCPMDTWLDDSVPDSTGFAIHEEDSSVRFFVNQRALWQISALETNVLQQVTLALPTLKFYLPWVSLSIGLASGYIAQVEPYTKQNCRSSLCAKALSQFYDDSSVWF